MGTLIFYFTRGVLEYLNNFNILYFEFLTFVGKESVFGQRNFLLSLGRDISCLQISLKVYCSSYCSCFKLYVVAVGLILILVFIGIS